MKKMIIVFNSIEEAGNYIIENLLDKTDWSYSLRGSEPTVEFTPTEKQVDEILQKKDEPEDFLCRTCDFWMPSNGFCSKHLTNMTSENVCVEHTYKGVQLGTKGPERWHNYIIRTFPDGTAACSCPDFKFRPQNRPCKHLRRVS